jgi:phage shock protein C
METKRLYRSRNEKMIGGVCGGLAEFLNTDPTVIRLAFVALALLGGHGVLVYIIMLLIVPEEATSSSPKE